MKYYLILSVCICELFVSCVTYDKTYCVNYQAIRQKYAQPTQDEPIPAEAKIAVVYSFSSEGELTAIVYNRTSNIMTIDQTQSFFVNTDGKSTSYYDPTIRTTSTTDMSSNTKGLSVNLGAVAGAFGIGGAIGQLANGINVGGAGTSGQSLTNTTYISDQPRVSLAPNSNGAMSKVFTVNGLIYENKEQLIYPFMNQEESHCRFSVCISYSFDEGKTFEKLVTEFYVESYLNVPLKSQGKISEALSLIEQNKPDMYNAPCWMLNFKNKTIETIDSFVTGIIYDYQ